MLDLKQLSNFAAPVLAEFAQTQAAMLYVNLSTEDGFVLGHVLGHRSEAEADKVSALASTLFSLAESSAQDISADRLNVLIMQSEKSCGVVVRSSIRSRPVVLSVAMDQSESLGHILYQANRVSNRLKTL